MAIKPLSMDEVKKMEKVCRVAAESLNHVSRFVTAGTTTNEIDQIVHDFMLSHNSVPAPLGYHGYPKSICTSVNEVICHGVPDDYKLKDGDIINVDVTAKMDGFFGDTSRTYIVGTVEPSVRDLVETAMACMEKGIESITPRGYTGDIGFEINKLATRKGYTTIKEIGGHGIGRVFHDEPFVPSWGKKGKGDRLIPFHCITVEPMINAGGDEFEEFAIPNSTIKWYTTVDGKLSAQFEHTVLITESGYEILTLP